MINIRRPLRGPERTPLLHQQVELCHPAYPDEQNVLLRLPKLDSDGIYEPTAQVACAILANNAWTGYVSEERYGEKASSDNMILHGDRYYFVVPGSPRYPIVPTFDNWVFPHSFLPLRWRFLQTHIDFSSANVLLQSSVHTRDQSCRVTDHIEGVQRAHIVPKSEAAWYNKNNMAKYGDPQRPDKTDVDNSRNAILLRSDVHKFFDDKKLVFVPRAGTAGAAVPLQDAAFGQPGDIASEPTLSAYSPPTTLVVHVLSPGSSAELARLYHNVELHSLRHVAAEYLFARFAWTVFSYARPFFRTARRVAIAYRDPLTSAVRERETLDELENRGFAESGRGKSKSRSQSPRKKRRTESREGGEAVGHNDEQSFDEGDRKRRRTSFSDRSWTSVSTRETGEDNSDKNVFPPVKKRRLTSLSNISWTSASSSCGSGLDWQDDSSHSSLNGDEVPRGRPRKKRFLRSKKRLNGEVKLSTENYLS